jgi:hypothetical protein
MQKAETIQQTQRQHAAWQYSNVQHTICKAFLLNPILFDNDTIEATRGSVTQYVLDPLHTIYVRVTTHLSVLLRRRLLTVDEVHLRKVLAGISPRLLYSRAGDICSSLR